MNELSLLDYEGFKLRTKALEEEGYWTPRYLSKRWGYLSKVVNLVKELNLKKYSKVLEMGTMGITCVRNADTMDYEEDNFGQRKETTTKKITYVHDARLFPWPVQDKSYDLFIALRVFMHLVPKQKECIREAFRIAKKVIVVVPEIYENKNYPDSNGIAYSDFVNFLDGMHPNIYTPTEWGELYYWDTENPSFFDLEGIIIKQQSTPPVLSLRTQLKLKIKEKMKKVVSVKFY